MPVPESQLTTHLTSHHTSHSKNNKVPSQFKHPAFESAGHVATNSSATATAASATAASAAAAMCKPSQRSLSSLFTICALSLMFHFLCCCA
eukprot:6186491-Pleurochrysis_carterae.AAC.1